MIKHFYIFRHGECPFNASGHIQGQRFNGPLTDNGISQAHQVGHRLQDKKVEVIISSPMKRAMQTAKIVQQYLQVPIFVDRRFIEVNMGEIEGLHFSVAEERFAETYAKWRDPQSCGQNIRFEGGESKEEVQKRLFEALEYYAEKTKFHTLAISAHGITISQTLAKLKIHQTDIANGAVAHLHYQRPYWRFEGFLD